MRYLGNKTRMIENISSFIDDLKIDGKVFCDLFTGSASVADFFKDRYQIIANDLLESSCVFASAKVKNGITPSFKKFKQIKGIDPFTYFCLNLLNKNQMYISRLYLIGMKMIILQ